MPYITLYEQPHAWLGCSFDPHKPPETADWEERVRVSHETLQRLQTGKLEEVHAILDRLSRRVLHLEEHSVDPAEVNVDWLVSIFRRNL